MSLAIAKELKIQGQLLVGRIQKRTGQTREAVEKAIKEVFAAYICN